MKRNRYNSKKKEVAVVKIKRAPGTPSKARLKAIALEEARVIRLHWQRLLITEAGKEWNKLHHQELAKVDGNVHVLAGLVQMRYQLNRQEADRQVKAFFAKHPVAVQAPVAAVGSSSVPPVATAMAAVSANP